MGPHSDRYLLQHWLPARALPLEARAAFAAEVTEVTRKEVAAAVGGMNCSTSVPACSNTSLHRAVAFRGCRWEGSFPLWEEGRGQGQENPQGKEPMLRKEKRPRGTKQTCCPPDTLSSPLLQGGHIIRFKGRKIQSHSPAFEVDPSVFPCLPLPKKQE